MEIRISSQERNQQQSRRGRNNRQRIEGLVIQVFQHPAAEDADQRVADSHDRSQQGVLRCRGAHIANAHHEGHKSARGQAAANALYR